MENVPVWFQRDNPNPDFFKQNTSKYHDWKATIIGNQELEIQEITNDYKQFIIEHNICFSDDEYTIPTDLPQKNIYNDLKRTFGTIRLQYQNHEPLQSDEIKLYQRMMRMMMVMHYKDSDLFKYRQTLIDLIIPIYHVVWFGLNEKNMYHNECYIVEAVTVELFMEFMKKTNQIKRIPGISESIYANPQTLIDILTNSLKEKNEKCFNILKQKNIPFELPMMQRYLLIFTQSLALENVIDVWDYLIRNSFSEKILSPSQFESNLIHLCTNSVLYFYRDIIQNGDSTQIMQQIQDISKLSLNDLLSLSIKPCHFF